MPNESAKVTPRATRNIGMSEALIETKPRSPAAPSAIAFTLKMLTKAPPTAAEPIPMKNGQRSRRFTPKIAGSVMPINAEAADAPARPFSLPS